MQSSKVWLYKGYDYQAKCLAHIDSVHCDIPKCQPSTGPMHNYYYSVNECWLLVTALVLKKHFDSSSFQKFICPLFKYVLSVYSSDVCLLTWESKSFHPSGFTSNSGDERWGIVGLLKHKSKPVILMCGVCLFLLPTTPSLGMARFLYLWSFFLP